jgi:hypothetical protein
MQRPCDELITRPRSPADCPRSGNRNETEKIHGGGQGPKLGCRATGKTIRFNGLFTTQLGATLYSTITHTQVFTVTTELSSASATSF